MVMFVAPPSARRHLLLVISIDVVSDSDNADSDDSDEDGEGGDAFKELGRTSTGNRQLEQLQQETHVLLKQNSVTPRGPA